MDANTLAMMMQQQGSAPLPPESALGPAVSLPAVDPMGGMGDPMMAEGMPSLGMGAPMPPAPFPSTDPGMLAQVVQQALAQQAEQDHMLLESQQQQAAMAAQPIIDQMLMQAAAPQPPMDPMGAAPMGPDPAQAFGEGEGLPPMPTEAGF